MTDQGICDNGCSYPAIATYASLLEGTLGDSANIHSSFVVTNLPGKLNILLHWLNQRVVDGRRCASMRQRFSGRHLAGLDKLMCDTLQQEQP